MNSFFYRKKGGGSVIQDTETVIGHWSETDIILDHASITFQLKIKEAIHIQWKKPTLNH